MGQTETEALIQLQKETIESLREMIADQQRQMKQMAESHAKQIAQLNQTIAGLNETVAYLNKKLFGSSGEKTTTKDIPGQISLFNVSR